MGTIENKSFKNIFKIPDDEKGILTVYMEGLNLCESMFKLQANKTVVDNINIFAGQLSQKEFNEVINVIRRSTNKPTVFMFFPKLNENEEIGDAYIRYEHGYRDQGIDNQRHFPDNIYINSNLVETDLEKDNLIRTNIKKKPL